MHALASSAPSRASSHLGTAPRERAAGLSALSGRSGARSARQQQRPRFSGQQQQIPRVMGLPGAWNAFVSPRMTVSPASAVAGAQEASGTGVNAHLQRPLEVCIAGGGIGGLVLAVALLKKGVKVRRRMHRDGPGACWGGRRVAVASGAIAFARRALLARLSRAQSPPPPMLRFLSASVRASNAGRPLVTRSLPRVRGEMVVAGLVERHRRRSSEQCRRGANLPQHTRACSVPKPLTATSPLCPPPPQTTTTTTTTGPGV